MIILSPQVESSRIKVQDPHDERKEAKDDGIVSA